MTRHHSEFDVETIQAERDKIIKIQALEDMYTALCTYRGATNSAQSDEILDYIEDIKNGL